MYTLFSHLVPHDSPYEAFWLRPRTFSGGAGLDSIAVVLSENRFSDDVHKGIDYKYHFSYNEEFNHLLTVTEQVISWEIDVPEDNEEVLDKYNYYGRTLNIENLQGIGYKIVNIQSLAGDPYPGETIVISLKGLLDKTFNVTWETPPQPKKTATTKRKR